MSTAAATADLTKLVEDLRKARRDIRRTSDEILDDTAIKVETLMKQYAPVLTGKLRNSIRIVSAPGIRTIGPVGVEYAVFQEFGTGIRGEFPTATYVIKPKKPGGMLHFEIDGKRVVTSEVHHPGIPPHPFARPAAHAALDNIEKTYADAGVQLIMEGSYGKAAA